MLASERFFCGWAMLVAFAAAACAGRSAKLPSEGPEATASAGTGGAGGTGGGSGGQTGGSAGRFGAGSGGGGGATSGGTGGAVSGSGGSGAATSGGTGGEAGRGLEICGTGQAASATARHALVVAVDRSAVMAESWADTSRVLSDLFADPAMDYYSVALRLFPDPRPVAGCDVESCSVDACATPLVPAAELSDLPAPEDAQEQALIDALMTTMPSMDVAPLGAAVEGAHLEAERLWSMDYRVSVVLVTAEIGNACERDLGALVEYAYVEFGTTTFVLRPASSEALPELDELAARGGSELSAPIGPGGYESDELVDVLVPIVSSALSCEFGFPDVSPGEVPVFDATTLTVTVDGATFVAERVQNARACGEKLAWYFDRVEMPTRLLMCPSLCFEVTSGSSAIVEISAWCD